MTMELVNLFSLAFACFALGFAVALALRSRL